MKNTKTTTTKTTTTKAKTTQAKAVDTKNAFDFFIDSQSMLVDSLVDNSKKIQEVFETDKVYEKSQEFVSEWLEKQEETLTSSVEMFKKQPLFENAPAPFKEMVAAQEELGKEWFDALKVTLSAKDAAKLQEILNANVEKLQSNMKSIGDYWMSSFGKPMVAPEMFTVDHALEMTKKMVDMWKPASVK